MGRRAEEAAVAKARRATLEADLAAAEGRLAEARSALARAEDANAGAGEALATAEAAAAESADQRAGLAEEAGRASVARAEVDERVVRLTAERAELEGDPDHGATDLVDRLESGGWERLTALNAIPPNVTPAVAAVLGDVGRALAWKAGADVLVAESAGDAHLLAPADGPPSGRDAALAAVDAASTLADLLGDDSAPEVLHRTVVAPNLGALLNGWRELPDGWAAVTLAGDVADSRGVVTVRGRAGNGSSSAGRAVRLAELATLIERMTREAGEARRRQADVQAAFDAASARADEATAALDAARAGARHADEERLAAMAAVEHLIGERERVAADLALVAAIEEEPVREAKQGSDVAALEASAREAREAREVAEADRDAARSAWEAAVRIADEHDALATDRRATAARHAERTEQLQRAVVRIGRERAVIGESIRAAAAALAEARDAEQAAGERRAAGDEAREQARQAILDAERRLGGGAGRMAKLDGEQQQIVATVSRLEEALAGLERERELSLEGLPEVTLEPTAPAELVASVDGDPDPALLSEEDLAEELRKTRRTLQQIGSVNPFAIEEHHELSARLTELTEQEADLRSASEATRKLIDRLDGEISEQFQAAFAAIGQRFDEYCRLLFAGGSASLELTQDEESEAPGGIEIAVRPPGKRLQRLAMLSGGERALAGVALLFAMLTVNPVPFCVLDEVDAALDEANIGRFADALRKLAETIDFVVITHNRATIETADTIYGVTMTDAAVSRVLSLRLADIPVEVEIPVEVPA
jgi:chromosome segregation protein